MVTMRCMNSMRPFSFLDLKFFSSISPFLVVAQVKKRCQRYQRGTLNSMRPFSFFGQKNFFLVSRFLEVAVVKVRHQQYQPCALNRMQLFVFRSKNFFLDLLISGSRSSEREVSTISTQYPEQYASIFVLRIKIFFLDISIFGCSF